MINIYRGNYKAYLPIVAVLYIVLLFLVFVSPGLTKGIDLEGGTLILVRGDKAVETTKLEALLKQNFQLTELTITGIQSPGGGFGLTIQYRENLAITPAEKEISLAKSLQNSDPAAALQHAKAAVVALQKFAPQPFTENLNDQMSAAEEGLAKAKAQFEETLQGILQKDLGFGQNLRLQVRDVRPILGKTFWDAAMQVSVISIILITIVIFWFFREIVPSIAVIAGSFFDVLAGLAAMAVFNIPLSLATIPALLMLFGYSIDDNIMLATRIFKRKDLSPREITADAMVTGLTMTSATLAALAVMLAISYFTQIFVIFELAFVLFFGLLADIISTWLMNAPILLMYVEGKKGAVA